MIRDLEKLAEEIYSILYGHSDSKRHRQQTEQEIEDWLSDGDVAYDATAERLAKEYEDLMQTGPE